MSDSRLDVDVEEALEATRVEVWWAVARFSGRPECAGEGATATCETPTASVMSWAYVDRGGWVRLDSVVLPRPSAPSTSRRGGDDRAARFPRLAALCVMWLGAFGASCWFSNGAWHPVLGSVALVASVVGLYGWRKP